MGSTPSMRARRPRLTLVSGCSARRDCHHQRVADEPEGGAPLRIHDRGALVRSALGKTSNLGVISAVYYRERVSTITPGTSSDYAGRQAPAPPLSAPVEQEAREGAARDTAPQARAKLAAPPARQVRRDWHGPPDRPRHRAGVAGPRRRTRADGEHPLRVPSAAGQAGPAAAPTADPLLRREGAHGFAPGFCPEPPRQR